MYMLTNRTIGKYVSSLIENKRYQEIILPTIPILKKREWDAKLIKLEYLNNREYQRLGLDEGESVQSFYAVDMKWYPARIIRVFNDYSYYVMYDVYANKEVRTRGHLLCSGEDPNNLV